MSDASHNYMKTTTSSDAKMERLQKSARTLSKRSSFKSAKSLTRFSSIKFRRSSIRRSSGGTELKNKLNKSSSIKLANRSFIAISIDAVTSASADYVKETSSSDVSDVHFQANPCNLKSKWSLCDETGNKSNNLMPNLASSGNKSFRVATRTTTLRPVRALMKIPSLKAKKPSLMRCCQTPDSSIDEATCSSALKGSEFPDHLHLQPGGSESERISALKLCPYSYCSLHGHRHSNLSQENPFGTIRRPLLKTEKSVKLGNQSSGRAKRSSNTKKRNQTGQMAYSSDAAVRETDHDSRATSSTRKMAGQKAKLNGEGPCVRNDESVGNSQSDAEIMLGEASYSHICLEENLNGSSKFPTAQRNNVVTCQALGEESMERCCIRFRTEADMLVSESTDTEKKEEGIIASQAHSGDQKPNPTVGDPEFIDLNVRISRPGDKLPFDDTVSNCHEEFAVDGEIHPEVDEDKISSLNLDVYKADSVSNTSGENTSIILADKLLDESKTLITGRFVESRAINNTSSSSSIREPTEQQIAAIEETMKDSVQEDCTTNVVDSGQMGKQKRMGLWYLMYQRMASGIAVENETQQPLDKVDEQETVEDANTLPCMDIFDSCRDFSVTDQSVRVEDYNVDSEQIQLYPHDVIKLVQQAFDKILSEIPDQSSESQSTHGDTTLDRELEKKSRAELGELTVSASSDSAKERKMRDKKEMGGKADYVNACGGEKAESKVRNDSNQKTPNSWSNVKKIIILKRFVKALEEVRNINLQKPQYLTVEPDQVANKVRLRHQTMADRNNPGDWMLDCALQHVISTLAPAQKRKVALLVQAFETVIPLPKNHTHQKSNVTASSHETPDQKVSRIGIETNSEIFTHETSCLQVSLKENKDKVGDNYTAVEHIPLSPSVLKETSLESGCTKTALQTSAFETRVTDTKKEVTSIGLSNDGNNSILKDDQPDFINTSSTGPLGPKLCNTSSLKPADDIRTSHEEFMINGVEEVPKEFSVISLEVHSSEFGFNKQDLGSNNQVNATGEPSEEPKSQSPKPIASSNLLSSAFTKLLEESSEFTEEEIKLENNFLQGLTPLEESGPTCATGAAHEKWVEKLKHTRLWYLIHKHMVSGRTTLHEGEDGETGDDENTLIGANNTHSHFPVINQDINTESHNEGGENIELQKIEAIKLVEQAIDEIPLLPDGSHDDESVNSDIIPHQKHLELKPDERGELSISTSIGSTKERFGESNNINVEESSTLDPKESWFNSENITAQEKVRTARKVVNRPKLPISKSWSNLKQLVLLMRFVNALGKVKNFNPREPQFLNLDPEKEAETINLRHQDIEDRKNSEEWMLDYALQMVVAKLTPARKRKVELLVEAFETVIPTTGS